MSNLQKVNAERLNIIEALAAAFPHGKPTAKTVVVYATFLADLDIDDLKRAAAYCMANSTYFPTMKELREAAIESDQENRPPTAGEAWEEITSAFHSPGSWGTPVWSHPLVERSVEAMGGWRTLCLSEDPGGVLRGQFRRIYEQLQDRAARDQRAALAGGGDAWKRIGALANKMALPAGSKGGD